jgi:phosphoribosylaminoimidazole-succinocarboxamide synthase
MTVMTTSALPLKQLGRGKVRDIYEVDADRLLLVATDRVSAFDVVMREAIPYKGAVLTQISAYWFGRLEGLVPHHLISANAEEIERLVPALAGHRGVDCRARDALQAHRSFPCGVRRSRLYFWVRLEGVFSRRERSPVSRSRRGCGKATSWRRCCSAQRRRRRPATTRTSRSPACAH